MLPRFCRPYIGLGVIVMLASPLAQAGAENVNLSPQKSGAAQQKGGAADCQEWVWETRKETRTRTVYENVTEEKTKTVYDTHYDTKTVQDVHKVSETHYRTEDYTIQVPYFETQTREVPYTVQIPIVETRSRNVNYVTYTTVPEVRTRTVPYTTYNTVQETRTRTIPYVVPREVPYTRTISIHTGHYETHYETRPGPVLKKCVQDPGCWETGKDGCRVWVEGKKRIIETHCPPIKTCKQVWVPKIEQKVINCTRIEYDTHTRTEPYTVCRQVPQTHTRQISYTVYRRVPVNNTRTVYYNFTRYVPEQRTRTVSHMVRRMTTETATRTIPYTVTRDVPTERTITVPRTVPRTVCYTVTRCVPRTESYEVEVRVCRPKHKSAPVESAPVKGDGAIQGGDTEGDAGDAKEESVKVSPSDDDQASVNNNATYPVSTAPIQSSDPKQIFRSGMSFLRQGNFADAQANFEQAAKLDGENAKYAYFWAVAAHRTGEMEKAKKALAIAVQRESLKPVANWGQTMERVQGESRLWLETARREAKSN